MHLTEDDRLYVVSLLKKFDESERFVIDAPRQGDKEQEEAIQPWLWLIIRGYVRYAREPLLDYKLALELTSLGRDMLSGETSHG